MNARLCACGCGRDLDRLGKRSDARYANAACRALASRERHPTPGEPQEAHRSARRVRRAQPRPRRQPRLSDYRASFPRLVETFGEPAALRPFTPAQRVRILDLQRRAQA